MIVVTGGAGFIGQDIIRELNERGIDHILVVDRLEDSTKWKNLRIRKYYDYIQADAFISNLDLISEDYDIKAIYHMGACSSTTEMDMDYLYENNVKYSQVLWDFCRELNIPFLYASSAATYGDGQLGYSDDSIEGLMPLNPYGFSKHLFDQWVLKQERSPLFWFGLKFFNVYGYGEFHKESMRSVALQAFEQITQKGYVKLFKSHREGYADGEQMRDFVYVKDLSRAMVKMHLDRDDYPLLSGIYNMGTGEARSFKALVEGCFKAMKKEVNIQYIDMPEHLRGQYQYYTKAQMSRFQKAFGEQFFTNFDESLEEYFEEVSKTDYLQSLDE